MESAIKTVVTVFLKSSKGKENLGEKDFQSLVKNQLKNILTDTDSTEAVKTMRQGLDSDKDGKVSFPEYLKLIGYIAESFSGRCFSEKETQVASSVHETPAEVPTVTNVEPKDGKQEEPVKEEVAAKVQEEEDEEEGEKAEAVEEIEETS
ncbi:S100 calcium binding protein U [Electrophorus electricus]|uniref:EF-hand domain-containing protein n=1 Tax=Electrophorus electricus TaxID=8005 RepID=A0AAY5EEK3_ELEEL|nr:S100 calcium binding protein U [Electrophorus electricus]